MNKIKTLTAAIGLICTSVIPAQAQPQAPAVVVTVEGTELTVFWNPVVGAKNYTLYYAPYPALTPIENFSTGSNTDFSINLPIGTAFATAITASDDSGESPISNIESFTIQGTNASDASASVNDIISSTASRVILATYEDLAVKAAILSDALANFSFTPTDDNLNNVKFAWRDTRRAWEQTESFLFGPVDTAGLDPALDSWPVNRTDLDNVLASDNALTIPFVAALSDTLHGFHTIEYLIFGAENNKQAADLTSKEKEYLIATTALLHTHADALADGWRTTGGDFISEFSTAGQGSVAFPSTTAALQELVNGMIGIVDEVGNGKISDPFSQQNTELVESQFSFNSLLDFENNIRGVENVYLGRYLQEDGPGLSDLVKRNNAELDTQIRSELKASIQAIQAIPFPFRDAISDEQGGAIIETAITTIGTLKTTLESQLLPNITAYQ